MGQKINPIGLRLHQNRTFDASWYNDCMILSFKHEQIIRKALTSFFQVLSQNISDQSLGRIFIQESHKKTIVTFSPTCKSLIFDMEFPLVLPK